MKSSRLFKLTFTFSFISSKTSILLYQKHHTQQINHVMKKFYMTIDDFYIMFERKFFKKSINIIQINASFSFSRQTRIINYFKLVALTFLINENLKSSKISLNSLKFKNFKNELFKTLIFLSSILQSTRVLSNHKLTTSKFFSSKRLHFIFASTFIFSLNFFDFFHICRFCRATFIYNNDLYRHFRINYLREKFEKL